MDLTDPEWASRLQEIPGLKEESFPEIFEVMDNVLLPEYPIIVRRINIERIKHQSEELPTDLIMRIMQDSKTVQLEGEPLVSSVLIKVVTLLPSDLLSDKCKDFRIQEFGQNPNLER